MLYTHEKQFDCDVTMGLLTKSIQLKLINGILHEKTIMPSFHNNANCYNHYFCLRFDGAGHCGSNADNKYNQSN